MYSGKPSDKPFPQEYSGDASYDYYEGADWGKNLGDIFRGAGSGIGGAFRGIGSGVGGAVGGAVGGVGTGVTGILGGITGGIGSIFNIIKWPLMIIIIVVIGSVLWSFLKETPEDKMMRMQMEGEMRREQREERQRAREERAASRAPPPPPQQPSQFQQYQQ